jgi:hypothetical protein
VFAGWESRWLHNPLQSAGLITYNHEIMSVIDRKSLEASCECYHAIQDEFDRLLGG